MLVMISSIAMADEEGDVIKADRQALADATSSGDSSKIIAAKEQLSDDLSSQENQKRKDLELICSQLKIDFVPFDINQGFDTILSAYLNKRSRMLR